MTKSIRPATARDIPGILNVADKSGLLSADELVGLEEMLTDALQGKLGDNQHWIVDESQDLCGAAYYAPEVMANATRNLYFIAVRRDNQGQGVGSGLLHFVEQELAARGERLLVIETSGLGSFERTRAFYQKHGYEEEARIRDFYDSGDDKVVFRKVLNSK